MTMRMMTLIVLGLVLVGLDAGPALAANGAGAGETPTKLALELGKLAVVAVIVESALSALFQWRVYRMAFNNKSLKTPVMFVTGLLVVLTGYDPFANIVDLAIGQTTSKGVMSVVLSAMIIAGGSAGVNSIFKRLGIRSTIADEQDAAPVLNETQAWISVRVKISKSSRVTGPVRILMAETTDTATTPPLAATLREQSFGEKLRAAFTADDMRFPSYGGRTVTAGKVYEIAAVGERKVQPDGTETEEVRKLVYRGAFAPRAVVDFTVEL